MNLKTNSPAYQARDMLKVCKVHLLKQIRHAD